MRRVIFTAVLGGYDQPPKIAPAAIEDGCDYLCFCDTDIELQSPWQRRSVECWPEGPAATNRRIKFRTDEFLPGYDQALYMDGNVDLLRFPADAFAALDHVACVFVAHPKRNSVRAEMIACIVTGKLTLADALALAATQARSGFDDNRGLTANRLFGRCLSDPCANALFAAVFDDYLRGPPRDQLHLQHALQRSCLPHRVMSRQWALDTFSVRQHIGVETARGRMSRALRRLVLGPLLYAVLVLVARCYYREILRHDR